VNVAANGKALLSSCLATQIRFDIPDHSAEHVGGWRRIYNTREQSHCNRSRATILLAEQLLTFAIYENLSKNSVIKFALGVLWQDDIFVMPNTFARWRQLVSVIVTRNMYRRQASRIFISSEIIREMGLMTKYSHKTNAQANHN